MSRGTERPGVVALSNLILLFFSSFLLFSFLLSLCLSLIVTVALLLAPLVPGAFARKRPYSACVRAVSFVRGDSFDAPLGSVRERSSANRVAFPRGRARARARTSCLDNGRQVGKLETRVPWLWKRRAFRLRQSVSRIGAPSRATSSLG